MVEVEVLENEIVPLAERYGLRVYDIEVVTFGRPLLRVFAERLGPKDAPGSPGVTIGELESFAKVLIPYLGMKNLFPREGQVEVSSPGLFRRLRRPEHFSAAVGESIGVTAKGETGKQTVKARLLAVTDTGISLENPALPFVPFTNILRAQLQPDVRL